MFVTELQNLQVDRQGFPLLMLSRTSVPGGWIYAVIARSPQGAVAVTSQFVPMPPGGDAPLPVFTAPYDGGGP